MVRLRRFRSRSDRAVLVFCRRCSLFLPPHVCRCWKERSHGAGQENEGIFTAATRITSNVPNGGLGEQMPARYLPNGPRPQTCAAFLICDRRVLRGNPPLARSLLSPVSVFRSRRLAPRLREQLGSTIVNVPTHWYAPYVRTYIHDATHCVKSWALNPHSRSARICVVRV